jgi:hypothetical protein
VPGFDGLSDDESRRLLHIGWGTRSLNFWGKVVMLQAERLTEALPLTEAAYADLEVERDDAPPELSNWDLWNTRVRADAHLLVVAVRHVLLHGRYLAEFSPEAAELLAAWTTGPHRDAETARGVLEHYDRYWIAGQGDAKRAVRQDAPVAVIAPDDDLTDFRLVIDQVELWLLAMARDAFALALKLSDLWNTRSALHLMRRIDPPDDLNL